MMFQQVVLWFIWMNFLMSNTTSLSVVWVQRGSELLPRFHWKCDQVWIKPWVRARGREKKQKQRQTVKFPHFTVHRLKLKQEVKLVPLWLWLTIDSPISLWSGRCQLSQSYCIIIFAGIWELFFFFIPESTTVGRQRNSTRLNSFIFSYFLFICTCSICLLPL